MKRSAAAACWPSSPTPLPRRRKSSMPFNCTICGEESTRICVWCTKDTCANHLCEKCGRCSDCCECEVPLEPVQEPAPVHEPPLPVQEPTPMPGEPEPPVQDPTPMPGEPAPPVQEPELVQSAPTDDLPA